MSRGRAVRFPAAGELPAPPEPVPVLGPVVFTLRFGGVERKADLSDLPCPQLVRPLAAALAAIGGDDGLVRTWSPDFCQMLRHLRVFARFAADRSGDPAGPFGLADLRPELLDAFEADLVARYGSGGTRAHAFMGTVIRLLRHAGAADPAALTGPVQARLGYATSLPHRPGRPLDAYPIPVLEAIQRAALADVRAIRDRIDAGRRRAGAGADPAGAGWSRPNALWHAAAHGPLTAAQFRGMHAVRCAPGGIGGINAELFLTPADLAPFLVALICLTGLEPECAKALRADCLSSPSAGFVTLSYRKNRAHTRTAKTMRVRDGSIAAAGGLIRLAVRLTGQARELLGGGALWAGAGHDGLCAFFDRDYELTGQLRSWAARQSLGELTDRDGGPVRLDLRRLRKSVKSKAYLRSGGVLDEFAAGHTKQVAAARYADIDAHRELHEQAVEAGLRQALRQALPAPVVATHAGAALPAPGATTEPLTPAQAHAAIAASQDVFLASCTDFNGSPFARSPRSPCPAAVWGCLQCPNAVFTERHLPSLAGFAAFLETQREELPAADWQARYGLAHTRLTTGIFPAFPAATLQDARLAAGSGDARALLPARLLEVLR